MSFSTLQKKVFDGAVRNGWWPLVTTYTINGEIQTVDTEVVNIPEKLMLMVSELGEALEHYRSGIGMNGSVYEIPETGEFKARADMTNTEQALCKDKPDGFWVEIADTVIRIMDLAEAYEIDLEAIILEKHHYNQTRPYRHGGKKC